MVKIICRSLLQETYEIKDCLFCSDGTSMDSEKWNADSTLTVSADSTGKSIVATGTGWYSALTDTKQQMGWTGDLTVEFDVISITGTVRFGIVNNNSNLVWITPTVGHYVRTVSLTELYRIGFRLGADMSIKFKNFVIYPV